METDCRIVSVAEILSLKPERKTRWGRWRLRGRYLEFHDAGVGVPYEIELDTMTTAAVCLDWIFQASNKIWMTNEDRGNLLQAIEDTVHPQGTLCCWGIGSGRIEKENRQAK